MDVRNALVLVFTIGLLSGIAIGGWAATEIHHNQPTAAEIALDNHGGIDR